MKLLLSSCRSGALARLFSWSPALLVVGAAPSFGQDAPEAEVPEAEVPGAEVPEAEAPDPCAPGDEVPVPPGLAAADVPSGSIRRADTTMGTTLALGASGVGCQEATAAFAEVFAEFHRIEVLTSLDHPDSELRRVNEAAGGEPVVVGEVLFMLLERALATARASEGAFDPTFAAMDGLWRFEPTSQPAVDAALGAPPARVPTAEAIEERRRLVDWTKVELDPAARTVRLAAPGMKLSLGGLNKGYATDRAVAILRRRGLESFIIRSGGEMFIEGDPGGGERRIGIPDPRGDGAFALVEVRGRALNISRDNGRFFVENGVRYHGILDPRTGYPAHHARTVAVMAADALTADALSTAVFVLGPKAGLALIETQVGAEALIVDSAGGVHLSSGFGPRLLLKPPTPGGP